MTEKNVVLEWTNMGECTSDALSNYIFTDRKEVRL